MTKFKAFEFIVLDNNIVVLNGMKINNDDLRIEMRSRYININYNMVRIKV